MLGLYIAECNVEAKIRYLSKQHEWIGDLPDLNIYLKEIYGGKSLKACYPVFVNQNGCYIGVIRMLSSVNSIEYIIAWLFIPQGMYISACVLRNKLQELQFIINKNEIDEQECISIENIDKEERLVIVPRSWQFSEKMAYRRVELTDYSWSEMFQWLYQDWLFNYKLVFLVEMDCHLSFSSSLMNDISGEKLIEYHDVHLTQFLNSVCLQIGNSKIRGEETPCVICVKDLNIPVQLNMNGNDVSTSYTLNEISAPDFPQKLHCERTETNEYLGESSANDMQINNDGDDSAINLHSKRSYILCLPYEVKGKRYFGHLQTNEGAFNARDYKIAGYKIDKIQENQIFFSSSGYKMKKRFYIILLLLSIGIGWATSYMFRNDLLENEINKNGLDTSGSLAFIEEDLPNLSESSGDVARQIIDACNYLNSNEIWNRDSMNARPYIVGLWDDLNRRNSKNIIDIWTPRLVEVGVHRWLEILEACRKITVKNYDNIFMLGENLDMDVYIELAYCDKHSAGKVRSISKNERIPTLH